MHGRRARELPESRRHDTPSLRLESARPAAVAARPCVATRTDRVPRQSVSEDQMPTDADAPTPGSAANGESPAPKALSVDEVTRKELAAYKTDSVKLVVYAVITGIFVYLSHYVFKGFADPMAWVTQGLMIVACIVIVAKGANWLVDSAVRIANRLGISKVVIGLTVVAFGTSAPEFAVSVSAGLQEHGSVAIGNVVGSNIFNLGFILGGVALITPLVIARKVVYRDGLALFIATALLFIFLWDLELQVYEGVIMFVGLIAYMVLLLAGRLGKTVDPTAEEKAAAKAGATGVPDDFVPEEVTESKATWWDLPIFIVGLAAVVAGCHYLVEGAIWYAQALNVPDWAIAVTIVAAGTSAPEFAVSLVAALKGYQEISAGNLIGSDLFNILGVLGVAAVLNVAAVGEPLSIQEPLAEQRINVLTEKAEVAGREGARIVYVAIPEERGKGPDGIQVSAGVAETIEVPLRKGMLITAVQFGDEARNLGDAWPEQGIAAGQPLKVLRAFLANRQVGQTIVVTTMEGTVDSDIELMVTTPAKIRLSREGMPPEVRAFMEAERNQQREGLNPAQWSLVALMGMVLLTWWFMRTGFRIGRFEGSVLVLIAISRWVFDFAIH
jgi:cation:H+ antiporter